MDFLHFGYKKLATNYSPINGQINVYSIFGSPRMSIGGLLQSGGIVADIWKKSIKQITNYQLQITNILILGLGCGTAAQIFSKRWPEAKITGVEIDPEIIRLGKKYFGLEEIPKLKIINQDAVEYIKKVKSQKSKVKSTSKKLKVDLVIVDLYLGEKIPVQSESLSFLRNLSNLLAKNGLIIFNRLFWNEHRQEAEVFVKKVEKIFPRVELVRTVANLLVICGD